MNLDIASEMKEPPNPMTAENSATTNQPAASGTIEKQILLQTMDAKWREHRADAPKHSPDLVICSQPYAEDLFLDDTPIEVEAFEGLVARDLAQGEWIGLAKLSGKGLEALRGTVADLRADGSFERAGLPDLFNRMIAKGMKPRVVYVTGHWLDVNDAFDLAWARNVL